MELYLHVYVVIKGMTIRHMDYFVYASILLHPFHMHLTEEETSPETSCILTEYRIMSVVATT
jgi:hypothetical protein